MRRILVLRGGALGDFIVTLPALALLRQHWPAARIELAGNATAAALAKARGLIDALHSQHEARWGGLFGDGPLPAEFAGWLAAFDLVVNFWPDPDGTLGRHFPRRAGQAFLTAAALPATAPAAAHYCAALAPLVPGRADHHFRLLPRQPIVPAGPAPILVHPGSGSPRKNWPAERWRELLGALARPVTLILGEAEAGAWGGSGFPGVSTLCTPELETLVAHLAGGRLYLGHDSGVSHLAAACGVPCVLLFGPTDPATWAPPGPQVRVLRAGPDLSAISVAQVWAAVNELPRDRR